MRLKMFCLFLLCATPALAADKCEAKKEQDVSISYSNVVDDTSKAVDAVQAKIDLIKARVKEAANASPSDIGYNLQSDTGIGGAETMQYNVTVSYDAVAPDAWPRIAALFLKDSDKYQVSFGSQEKICDKKK